MKIIRHRINSIEALKALDPQHGAEFDIRSRGDRLILNHEPHRDGESLEDFLSFHARSGRTGTMIFNPKADGLEDEILALIRSFRLRDFFFLDLTLPTTVRLALREGIPEIALRVSEYEPPEGAARFEGKVRWIWLDCFTGEPPSESTVRKLKERFEICLVSPELERYPKERVSSFRHLASLVDAVCTKHPELWAV